MKTFAAFALLILLSAALAYIGTCFQKSYLTNTEFSLKKCLPKEMRVFSVGMICYITAAVYGLLTYTAKQFSLIQLTEMVILWQGLLLVSYTDIKVKKIPNKVLLVLLCVRVVGMAGEILIDGRKWDIIVLSSVIGMAVGGVIILICMILSRGGIGAGDLKLYAIIGFFCSTEGLAIIMVYSIIFAALTGIVLLIFKKAKMKSTLPMGPFIFAGLTLFLVFK